MKKLKTVILYLISVIILGGCIEYRSLAEELPSTFIGTVRGCEVYQIANSYTKSSKLEGRPYLLYKCYGINQPKSRINFQDQMEIDRILKKLTPEERRLINSNLKP